MIPRPMDLDDSPTGGIVEARRPMLRICARRFVSTPGYKLPCPSA
jgi:hypothetical protein